MCGKYQTEHISAAIQFHFYSSTMNDTLSPHHYTLKTAIISSQLQNVSGPVSLDNGFVQISVFVCNFHSGQSLNKSITICTGKQINSLIVNSKQ